jgi:hypothetical protein
MKSENLWVHVPEELSGGKSVRQITASQLSYESMMSRGCTSEDVAQTDLHFDHSKSAKPIFKDVDGQYDFCLSRCEELGKRCNCQRPCMGGI